MFKFTRIAEENREAFEALLPTGFKSMDLESFGLLGKEDLPIAAMVLSVDDDDIISIKWLYVDPDYRRCGAASMLISSLEKVLEKEAFALSISYPEGHPDLDGFLTAFGFCVTEGDPVWYVPVMEAAQYPDKRHVFPQKMKGKADPVASLKNKMRNELLGFLEREAGTTEFADNCDPERSFVIQDDDNKIEAVLLTEQVTNDHYMVTLLLNTGSPDNPLILTKALIDGCLKNADQQTVLMFVAANRSVDNFINTLFGDGKIVRKQLKYAVYSLE